MKMSVMFKSEKLPKTHTMFHFEFSHVIANEYLFILIANMKRIAYVEVE